MKNLLFAIAMLITASSSTNKSFNYTNAFSGVYDTDTRCPVYTKYWALPFFSVSVERSKTFKEVDTMPTAKVFEGWSASRNMDRGHMVPAEDMSYSYQSMDYSFLMTNICPQSAKLNQMYWSALERYVRDTLAPKNNGGYVWTGPLYRKGKLDKVGTASVPSHYFKVFCKSTCTAWVYTNDTAKQSRLTRIVDVKALSAETGIIFGIF